MTNQEQPDTRPRCGGTPGKPLAVALPESESHLATMVSATGGYYRECYGCPDCDPDHLIQRPPAPDTQSGGRPTFTLEEVRAEVLPAFERDTYVVVMPLFAGIIGGLDRTRADEIAGYLNQTMFEAATHEAAALQEARDALVRMVLDDGEALTDAVTRAESAEATISGLRAELDREKADGIASRLMLKASREQVSAQDRELAALSSDKQTLMTAVTYWREQVEGLRGRVRRGSEMRLTAADALDRGEPVGTVSAYLRYISDEAPTTADLEWARSLAAATRPVPPDACADGHNFPKFDGQNQVVCADCGITSAFSTWRVIGGAGAPAAPDDYAPTDEMLWRAADARVGNGALPPANEEK